MDEQDNKHASPDASDTAHDRPLAVENAGETEGELPYTKEPTGEPYEPSPSYRPPKAIEKYLRRKKGEAGGLSRREVIGLATLVFMIIQTVIYYWTFSEVRDTAKATQTAANAAQTQANVSLSQTNAIERSANAAQTQANASQIQANTSIVQANVSQRMAEQNKGMLEAAQTQANTSQVSARAAEQGVGITQETFRLLERPSLGVETATLSKFEVGQEIEGIVEFKNSGHTPARNTAVRSNFSTQKAGDGNAPCPEPQNAGLIGLVSRSPIPINGTKQARPHTFIKATSEDIERIGSGNWWLYMYAITTYEGVSGKKYFTEYYGRYSPKKKAFEDCGTHNDAN